MMQAAMTKRRRLGWWKEFLPISIPITAITLFRISVMTCSFHLVPPASLRADRGQEHGRTIPLADVAFSLSSCSSSSNKAGARACSMLRLLSEDGVVRRVEGQGHVETPALKR